MKKIKLLDCTLRDGGYVNSWKFGKSTIQDILNKLSSANIDIIECGFLSDINYRADLSIFSQTDQLKKMFYIPSSKTMYVGMIALGEKSIHYSKILHQSQSTLDGIRITFHKDEVNLAAEYALDLQSKGYKVFLQPIGTFFYTDIELLKLIEFTNEIHPFAFYIVDTLGSARGSDLTRLFHIINHNLAEDIELGFHSHNNLQLSFSNSQLFVAMSKNRNVIIDASVLGMGRGAGNLCTELIAEYINLTYSYKYNCNAFLSVIDDHLSSIQKVNFWGYSAPYYLAAIKRCHPNYASYLLSKQTLTSTDVSNILKLIPHDVCYLYKKDLIEKIYLDYQEHAINDMSTRHELAEILKNKRVLLIAPGQSITKETAKINALAKEPDVLSICVNFSDYISADAIFVSNKKRYESISAIEHPPCIVTSNLQSTLSEKYEINYASLLNSNELTYDNAGLMIIKLLFELEVKQLYLAGFDGFSTSNANYYDSSKKSADDFDVISKMNKEIQGALKYYSSKFPVEFITESNYKI